MFIGVDAGTSIIKAVSFDVNGDILANASRPSGTRAHRPGYAEQNLSEIQAATYACIRELTASVGDTVDLLAITAQGDGLWLFDHVGNSIAPGVLWSDARAAEIVSRWEKDGTAERAYRLSGNVPFAGSQAALLRHVAEYEPNLLDQAETAGYPKDAIYLQLTGERVTDESDASLPFLDHSSRSYDPALLQLFDVERWRHLLAPIDHGRGAARPLTENGARLTGLPVGTPVHCGPFDFPATTVGAGLRRPGDGLIAFGTTVGCGVLIDNIDTSGEPAGMTLSIGREGRWLRLLPAMAGTLALDWVLPLLGASHDDLESMLAQSRPGAGGVMVLPFVATAGERAPFVDPEARGRLIGLSTATSQADIARAVCEGIAYAARHCLDAGGLATEGTVTICGGGSRTPALRRLVADVLGRPMSIARQPETGARGAVITALEAMGIPFDHAGWTRPDGNIEPNQSNTSLYERGYQRYLEEVQSARGTWSGPVS